MARFKDKHGRNSELLKRLTRTQREIDDIYSEYAEAMDNLRGAQVAILYIRYSTKDQDSAAAQARQLLEHAVKLGLRVPREFICLDLALRGSRNNREGLQKATDALESGDAQALLVFSTNRLFRKLARALVFVDKAVKEWGSRIVFVRNGLDTADPQFSQLHYQVLAMLDEHSSQMYRDHIRAEHQQMNEEELICGTETFGYGGEPIPGKQTKRGRPRRKWVIDELARKYVELIFHWFTRDEVTIEELVRRLNADPEAPLPPKCKDGWTRLAVRKVLTNERYLGIFAYGISENIDLPSKNYSIQRKRNEPLSTKLIPRLQIIDEATWLAAQRILSEYKGRGGRRTKDGRPSPSRILRRLFYCPEHEQFLYIGGANGKYLYCKKCRQLPLRERCLFSQLNCKIALKVIVEALANAIALDEKLVDSVVHECREIVGQLQKPDPKKVSQLKHSDQKLATAMSFAKRNPGDTEDEEKETQQLLKELRSDRLKVQQQLAQLRTAEESMRIPKESEIRERFDDARCLLKAASSNDVEQLAKLRRLVLILTGGRITLRQCGERIPRRGWLEGSFMLNLEPLAIDSNLSELSGASPQSTEVGVSFKKPLPYEDEADKAFELDSEQWLEREIAEELECSRSKVTKLLQHSYTKRGLQKPDGRKRKARLPRKQVETPVYQKVADEAVRLMKAGHSDREIGRKLEVSDATVAKAIRWWHAERGESAPTSAQRRGWKLGRAMKLLREGLKVKEVAPVVGYSPRGLTLALKKLFANQGRPSFEARKAMSYEWIDSHAPSRDAG